MVEAWPLLEFYVFDGVDFVDEVDYFFVVVEVLLIELSWFDWTETLGLELLLPDAFWFVDWLIFDDDDDESEDFIGVDFDWFY